MIFDDPIGQAPNYAKRASQLHINHRGATAWNSLPVEIRLIQTYNQLRIMQKKLIQIYYDMNHYNHVDVKKFVTELHVN